jgi:SAM-dependent methyltransferase
MHYDNLIKSGDTTDSRVWVDDFTGRVFVNLSKDCEVVDVGCRIGRFVPLLPQLGVSRYFGIDPSVESITYCKRTFSDVDYCRVQFEVGEARQLGEKYPKRFAGFMLAAVLMHIPRTDLHQVLRSIRTCLKDEAPGFFSTPVGYEEDGELEIQNISDMEISRYTRQELTAGFESAGFAFRRAFVLDNMFLGHVIAV